MKITISSILLALLVACGSKDSDKADETPPTPVATEDAAAAAAATSDAAVADEIPTVADFEEEVNEEITDDNLEKQLDELEKEIGE